MIVSSLLSLEFYKITDNLTRVLLVLFMLTITVDCVQAQIKNSEVQITTIDNLKLKGKVVNENEGYLLLVLRGIHDTIRLEPEVIKSLKITQHSLFHEDDTELDVLITTKDDLKFLGTVVDESEEEVSLALKNISHTITISKHNIKRYETQKAPKKYKQNRKKNYLAASIYESVKLKNGSLYKGKIIEEDENKILMYVRYYGDTLSFDKRQIKKVISHKNSFVLKKGRYNKKVGYQHSLNHLVSSDYYDVSIQTQYVLSKFINPYNTFGGGLGYHTINESSSELEYADIFVYGKHYFNKGWGRLYSDIQLGIAIPLEQDRVLYTAGPKLQPGLGVEFARRKNRRWKLNISHLFQYTKIERQDRRTEAVFKTKKLFSRTAFGIGMIF